MREMHVGPFPETVECLGVQIEDGEPIEDTQRFQPGDLVGCKSPVFEYNAIRFDGTLMRREDGTFEKEFWQTDVVARAGADNKWHLDDISLEEIERAKNREIRDAFLRENFQRFLKFKANYKRNKRWQ